MGMTQSSLLLERESLGRLLPALSCYVHAVLDSTNSEAKRLSLAGERGPALVFADAQTAGRGRMGRSFFSPADSGAYFSFLYTPQEPLFHAVSVTAAAAVAVMQAIRDLTGLQTEIKWVNDLYLGGKKVCGILCESVCVDGCTQVIVGIGINLSTVQFPPELAEKAGALGRTLDRPALIAAVWEHLRSFLQAAKAGAWLQEYRAHSCVIGKPIVWIREGVPAAGVACGIDGEGGLEVETDSGERFVLRTGEISVLVDTDSNSNVSLL